MLEKKCFVENVYPLSIYDNIELITKPVQKPIFRLNKKQCPYLIENNHLITFDEIIKYKNRDKNKKYPNVVIDIQIDSEFNNSNSIDMSNVVLSREKTNKKVRNSIENYTIPQSEIDKFLDNHRYKEVVTVQIKGYNPNDKTYIYVADEQLEKIKFSNVNYTINDDQTIELPNMPSNGIFNYENMVGDQLVKWNREYQNRVSNEDFLIIDWIRQQGYEANIRHEKLSKEHRKKMPTLFFKFYGHFLLVDIPTIFKQGTPYYEDLKKAYLRGNITQTRRLMGKSSIDDTCYFPDWIVTINNIDYKIGVKIIDTIGLMGGDSSKLKDYCANTGTPIAKEMIDNDEIKDMSSTHIKDPYKVHKYGAGDLVMTELLMNYSEMMKEPYKTFNIENGYTPPALTMGKTVKNLFESIIIDYCNEDVKSFINKSEKDKKTFFENKTYKASASYLSTLAFPDCNAHLLSKCFGGMIRNNRPLISEATDALSDKDFTSAYAKTMSQLIYPVGNPTIVSFKNVKLGEFLKKKKHDLVDNLYFIIIKTPENICLKYEQTLFPSWDNEKVDRIKRRKQDSEGFNITGVVDLNSGYVKTFSKKLINTPIVSCNIDFIENELTPRQKEEIYNCEILTAAYYPKSLQLNNFKQLEEKEKKYEKKKSVQDQIQYDGWNIINPNDCHSWTGFKLGNIVDELTSKRNSYPKSHPSNALYKLLNNTLYGDQVSQYFISSNMIVGNNITGILRQQMFYSKTSLYMYGAITDGSISNENEVLFPKYRTKNPIIEGRIFEYTGYHFEAIDQLNPIIENVMLDRVKYKNQVFLLNEFEHILNKEIVLNGFTNFPNSLILKVLPAKPVKGEYLNKEKISRLYNLSKKEIYSNNIGHIKPLIGNSKILLNKEGYTIDGKKYSIEEGIKIIEKASTEHPRKIWKNAQLLNGFYFVLEKTNDGVKKYRLQQGLHNIEIKKPIVSVKFQGQGNYHTKDLNNEEDTKRRGYESLKKKHIAFKFSDNKEKIETDDNYYNIESPATKGMKSNLRKYPHFLPFIKAQIIKPKAYQKSRNKWMQSSIIAGEESFKVFFMRPLSLSQFTFQSEKQRNAWMKADNIMKRKYSYGLELYFINNDGKTFNIEKMIKKFDKMITDGVIHPRPTLDKSNHINRKIPDWVYENHHAIKLMKLYIDNVEMDNCYDSESDDYLDEYYNDNFS
jgi:hypothetical protein